MNVLRRNKKAALFRRRGDLHETPENSRRADKTREVADAHFI
jgi:hypothetical protein